MAEKPVVLVTGGIKRIGAKISQCFAAQGYRVLMHYRSGPELAQHLVDNINQNSANTADSFRADLCAAQQVQDLAQWAIKRFGRVDVLVNNASSFYPTQVSAATSDQWDDLMNSNARGAFFLTQALMPSLLKQNGNVVNIVDVHEHNPLKDYALYNMAKATLRMMTKTLAKELAPEVRVNAVAPGAILWPEGEAELDAEQKQQIIDKTLLKRVGRPQDIADAVWFLSQSNYITGQIIAVDGGRSLK